MIGKSIKINSFRKYTRKFTENQLKEGDDPMAELVQEAALLEARTRAVLYNIFADAMSRKIDPSWLKPEFQEKLESGLPEVEGKQELIDSLTRAAYVKDYFEEIQLDYDALFIVPGPKLIFPYESCYTHRNIDGSFGRLWQEPAQDMQRILKDWEIKFADGWDLIPDHVAVELFFMGHLCHMACVTELQAEDKEKILEWEKSFFESHLNNWVFELLDNLIRKAETGFYRGLAMLMRAFLEEEKAGLE